MPSHALEEKLRRLGLAGRSPGPAASAKRAKVTFRLYFPRPPYNARYNAVRGKDDLLNFTGLLLGHHGTTIQRMQRLSGCKIEIHGKDGNLNGDHPSPGDPGLHALITGDTKEALDKAVALLVQVLSPTDTTYAHVKVAAGGSAVLRPVNQPPREVEGDPAAEEAPPALPPLPEVGNAWASRGAAPPSAAQAVHPRGAPPAAASGCGGSPPIDIPAGFAPEPPFACYSSYHYPITETEAAAGSASYQQAAAQEAHSVEGALSARSSRASLWMRTDSQQSAASDMSCGTAAPAEHLHAREFSLWDNFSTSLSFASHLQAAAGPSPGVAGAGLRPSGGHSHPFPGNRGDAPAGCWHAGFDNNNNTNNAEYQIPNHYNVGPADVQGQGYSLLL